MIRALLSDRETPGAVLLAAKTGLRMFQASQLTKISSRFPAHVQDIREFLLKEKLPVPSPDAVPQLSSRVETDALFRADLASLMRATLYQEREEIGYEDLLGILVAAAAGTEQDLTSDTQEASIREMLRFLLQSRRSTFRPEAEPEESTVSVEPEVREPVPVSSVHSEPVHVDSEPVLRARGSESAAQSNSKKLELKPDEPAVAVAEAESREPGDLVLRPLDMPLFAAQAGPDPSRSTGHSVWIVGVVCMLVGVGLGLMMHRVVSAAETQVAVRAAASSSSKAKTVGSVAPSNAPMLPQVSQKAPPLPVGTGETASVAEGVTGAQPAVSDQVRSTPEPSSKVPVTVVKQVVTESDARGETGGAQSTAKTRSIVPQGAAGITPASVIFSPAPNYPADAAAARVHGEVTVHAVVDPDGNVIYARAVSGPPLLRDAAEEAVHRWRYSPLLSNGKPIAVATTAIVDFRVAR